MFVIVYVNSSLSINGLSFYQSHNNSNLKKIKKIPTAATHDGKEQIPPWATALPQRHADAMR
jgi:hypothetical protein